MAKITRKLQLTLPKRLAALHGLTPGDEVRLESVAGVIRVVPAGTPPEVLGVEERLRLFNEASRRISPRSSDLPRMTAPSRTRWTRDELHERGTSD
jgi:bifunctional DNA-binding transcriptional regulator/antitoxin component of YhaV-PrlF toxin-antitoxin module